MKVCLISNLFDPYILGGAEKYVGTIADGLTASGCEVVVITTAPSVRRLERYQRNFTIYRYNPLNVYHTYHAKETSALLKPLWHLIDLWNPYSFTVVKELLKEEKPDIVHTHNLGGISLSAFSAIRALRLPHIHTLHDYSLLCPRATFMHGDGTLCTSPLIACRLYARVKRELAKSPDVVTAPSRYVLRKHTEEGYFSAARHECLPLGIAQPRGITLQKHSGPVNILFVGQIVHHKGIGILLNAFMGIDDEDIHLHIVGKGPDLDRFRRMAAADRRITFHGFVTSEELDRIFRTANCMVVPSLWHDNSPMVIYEALSYGLPVIGSRVGGIPELIEDGCNGFLVEPGNIDELRSKLNLLISNPDLAYRLGQNALLRSEEYSMENHIKRLQSLYEEAIQA